MFFDDALKASKELEITLTGKECGLKERAPMCGVPFHAVDSYLYRLVQKGYKVAIAEQMDCLLYTSPLQLYRGYCIKKWRKKRRGTSCKEEKRQEYYSSRRKTICPS